MGLARRLELPERLLTSLANDIVYQCRWCSHLLFDIPTEFRLRLLDGSSPDPFALLTHRASHSCSLLRSQSAVV